MEYKHDPVLLKEAIDNLNLKKGSVVIDGTVGGAGHSETILKKIMPAGFLLGFDLDPEAIVASNNRLEKINIDKFQLINDNFARLDYYGNLLKLEGKIDSALLDLGVSSQEIDNENRGFSFKKIENPLDMRMDPRNSKTAANILNSYSEKELAEIIAKYGEEPYAKKIARRVIFKRKTKKFEKVEDLLQIIYGVYKGKRKPKKIHPATKTWQALRIEVNQELANLEKFLEVIIDFLKPGGRLSIISFHSLEDRIVKNFFKKEAKDCLCPSEIPICQCSHQKQIKIITKKPIIAGEKEVKKNPRARSAKLRVMEKI